jgi:hypothetical protein
MVLPKADARILSFNQNVEKETLEYCVLLVKHTKKEALEVAFDYLVLADTSKWNPYHFVIEDK